MSLPTNIQAKIDDALAKGDAEAAGKLARAISEATRTGHAQGFEGDLVALQRLASTGDLGKLAKGAPTDTLNIPPDALAKSHSLIAAIEHADSPEAQKSAVQAAEAFLGDLRARDEITKAFANPKKMGVAGCATAG